jgi:integrase/recombinase XerD
MSRLRKSLRDYLAMRRGLGVKLERSGQWLEDFVSFIERRGSGHINCALALAWAQQPATAQPFNWALRLSAVRGFARFMCSFDPRTEVPPSDLLPYRYRRQHPHIYTDEELQRILTGALQLWPPSSIRPRTYFTLFGLLIVTGLRSGEAINLELRDVDLEECLLTVRSGKFGKDRLVPIHPSTRDVLADYRQRRARLLGGRREDHFFVTRKGTRLSRRGVHNTFERLTRKIGLRGTPSGRRPPRMHDFRHRLATMTLVGLYRSGKDPERYLPILSTLLGHVKPSDTFWYLQQHPEIMKQAMRHLERRWKENR